jgi:hypothetical protein
MEGKIDMMDSSKMSPAMEREGTSGGVKGSAVVVGSGHGIPFFSPPKTEDDS